MFVYNSVIYIWGGFQNNTLKDILLSYIFWVKQFRPISITALICRKVYVRGLCSVSLFDTVYYLNIGDDGDILYFGELSSIVFYDKVT